MLRFSGLLASLAIGCAAANADPVVLNAGEWLVSMDIKMTMANDVTLLQEHTTETECWLEEEELTLDPTYFEIDECSLSDTEETSFGFKAQVACDFDSIVLNGSLIAEANTSRDGFAGRMEINDANYLGILGEILFLGYQKGTC